MAVRTKEEQAAYMRDYRRRKKSEAAAGGPEPIMATVVAVPDKTHAACDAEMAKMRARIVDLETKLRASTREVGQGSVVAGRPNGQEEVGASQTGEPQPRPSLPMPAFLVARDDDCPECRHGWHDNEQGCRAKVGTRPTDRCGCKSWRDAAEPEF